MALPNAKWYDNATLEEMHADLKVEYLKTLAVITNRPQLLKHFNSCEECQTIKVAQEGEPETPSAIPHRELLRRRKILMLTTGDLTDLLGLPANAGILFARTTGENDVIEVTVCSPDYEPVEYGEQPVVARLEAA